MRLISCCWMVLLLAATAGVTRAAAQAEATAVESAPHEREASLGDGAAAEGGAILIRAAHVRDRNRTVGLTIPGIALLVVGWVTNVVGGLLAGTNGIFFSRTRDFGWEPFAAASVVPVLGPWIQLALKPTGLEQDDWATWLVINGLVQAAALTTLILALVHAHSDEHAARDAVELFVAPAFSPSHVGVTLTGRY